ncbi:MAG: PepSY domain-containing protein [Nodosilinea sp. LVE1205-7]|jgi:uncharacterized iron-regulated membrane protein
MLKFKTLRHIHRFLAPVMLLPIILTVLTGSLYQLADMTDHGDAFDWVLDAHKGHFGPLNLEAIYPFLNSLGLLLLVVTGIMMWFQVKHRSPKHLNPNL